MPESQAALSDTSAGLVNHTSSVMCELPPALLQCRGVETRRSNIQAIARATLFPGVSRHADLEQAWSRRPGEKAIKNLLLDQRRHRRTAHYPKEPLHYPNDPLRYPKEALRHHTFRCIWVLVNDPASNLPTVSLQGISGKGAADRLLIATPCHALSKARGCTLRTRQDERAPGNAHDESARAAIPRNLSDVRRDLRRSADEWH